MNDNMAGFFLDGWYCFDNYAPFQIEWRGELYSTSEHAYQAAHFFNTAPDLAEETRLQRSPRLASDFASTHSDRDDPDWKSIRVAIMRELVRAKYEQHELIRRTLHESGDRVIAEMNDEDGFWGWGPDHNGVNTLGQIWMELRDEVRRSNKQ